MVIRNLAASWPPSVTIGTGEPANLEDSVVGANKKSEGHIVLMVRAGSGSVYGLLLLLPNDLLDKALVAITERLGKGITLRDVGELDIS